MKTNKIVAKLRSDHLVALNLQDKNSGHYEPVHSLHLPVKTLVRGWVKGYPQEVLIVRRLCTHSDGRTEFVDLVCRDLSYDVASVFSTYSKQRHSARASTALPSLHKAKSGKTMLVIAAFFLIVGAAVGAYWFLYFRFIEKTDDAYVQGNVIQITPQIAGTVTKIYADDTTTVKAGEPLVALDSSDADISLTNAEAQLAQTVREVRTLYSSQAQAQANLGLRSTELSRALDDLSRRKKLAGTGAVAEEEIRHAEHAVASARAQLAVAQQQLSSGDALTRGTLVAKHPNVQRAAARVYEAVLNQSRTVIYAPMAGQIAKRSIQVGQRVSPGMPLLAIVPMQNLWIEANFKESQLRNLRVGQQVLLHSDAYGSDIEYSGKIVGLSAGTGAAFSLLPPQNASGNWIKVIQRVPVRISLMPENLDAHPLRVGLSMQVKIDVRNQPEGATQKLSPVAREAILSSQASQDIDQQAKQRIQAIIAANMG